MGYRLFYIYQTTKIKIINYYLFYDQVSISAQKKESGELSILLQIGVPTQVLQQMDIYAFHLLHPEFSQLKLAIHLNTSQATVQRAIAFMSKPVQWDDSYLWIAYVWNL